MREQQNRVAKAALAAARRLKESELAANRDPLGANVVTRVDPEWKDIVANESHWQDLFVQETDHTFIPNVGSTVPALVGTSNNGPVYAPIINPSEVEFTVSFTEDETASVQKMLAAWVAAVEEAEEPSIQPVE